MKLYEFQGKKLFAEFGIPIPKGSVIAKTEKVSQQAPCVLKAQVMTGGRGKAGGIILCKTAGEVEAGIEKIFSMTLKGESVPAILAEQLVEIEREFYVSIAFDGESKTPLFIASAAGGMEIEHVAEAEPEKILKLPFDAVYGPKQYELRKIADFLGVRDKKELIALLEKLYRLWKSSSAILVEINPLVQTPNGLIALDAKIELDDDGAFRKGYVPQFDQGDVVHDTITYVQLDGDIGFISDGAGTGMLTLDLVSDMGGKCATFCELGGITNADIAYESLDRVISKNPHVKSVLIVLIGGFNRMDEMAEGIVRYYKEKNPKMPLVVRLCGTMEDEGKRIMADAGLKIYNDLIDAIRDAVGVN